jgi:Na+-driven multidrug efflux pump
MPLIFLIISSVINVALGLLYIYLKKPVLIPRREHFKFDKELYQELAGQGFSMGMMMAIVSSGTVILQRSINGFGYLTIAAHATARKINSFCIMPCATVSASLATFVSQNKGADNRDRIIKGVTAGFKILRSYYLRTCNMVFNVQSAFIFFF